MSAPPCSKVLPWLPKAENASGEVSLVSISRGVLTLFTHSMRTPSASNRPSRSATSSARPWKGAVVSSLNVFMGSSRDSGRGYQQSGAIGNLQPVAGGGTDSGTGYGFRWRSRKSMALAQASSLASARKRSGLAKF